LALALAQARLELGSLGPMELAQQSLALGLAQQSLVLEIA
jgi:hypothetical protein